MSRIIDQTNPGPADSVRGAVGTAENRGERIAGVVVRGHGVASGRAGDPRFPRGTIAMQIPFFRERGLDLAGFHPGTVNVDCAPLRFRPGPGALLFERVKWHPGMPAETFSFARATLVRDGASFPAWIYWPHPETKPEHFQPRGVAEVIAPPVPGLAYGDRVILETTPDQARWEPEASSRPSRPSRPSQPHDHNMSTIVIVGSGMMGSALAFPARENGNTVRLVGSPLDGEIIDACRATNRHPKFAKHFPEGIPPFPAGVEFYKIDELDRALEGADLVIGGVSSFGVDWFGDELLPRIPVSVPVLSVTKGLFDTPDGKLLTYPELWRKRLAAKGIVRDICAIGGPCTSYELVAHDQTEVAFCGASLPTLRRIRAMMATPYYHISLSTDVTGIESAVALKNGYALGIALTVGLNQKERGLDSGLHFNSQAAVFGQAAKEMSRLLDLQGAGTLDNLCVGVGDLYVTVYGGRTREVGILLGRGLSIDEAKAALKGVTLESLVVAERVGRAVKARIATGELRAEDFPLLLHIDRLLAGEGEAALPWERFTFEAAAEYGPAAPVAEPAPPAAAPAREHPLVLAHRGGLGDYDDNAVGGFADALARGILGAETDVRLSRDGELVIMHDPTVDRTTNGAGRVDEKTIAELTALRLSRSGENVPTFRQFCEVYRGRADVDVEIEMKEHGDEMTPERLDRYVRLLHDQAIEGGLVEGTYAFTSFSVPTLERFRALYPDARLGLICIELTEKSIAEAARLGCMRIAPEWRSSGPLGVAKAHAAGLSVNLWCSDSPFVYDTVKAWGADVSTSNVPRAIIAHARAASR